MSSDYEKTFSVRVPPERAFRAFTDPNELEQWFTPKFDADAEEGAPGVKADAESPGGDVHFEVTQIKGDELLCYRQWAADPEMGIDVTVVFEPVEGGTRITVTHAGFGGDSILKSDSVRNGMFENYADLILYLESGRVLEQGSHEELMRLGGHYASLYTLQTAVQERPLQMSQGLLN